MAAAIVAVLTSAGMLYFFLVGLQFALLPMNARRPGEWVATVTDAMLFLAPVPVLAGPMLAWRRRVEGASMQSAWRYAALSWLMGGGVFALAVALRVLGS